MQGGPGADRDMGSPISRIYFTPVKPHLFSAIYSMGFSGTPKDMGPPYGKRDPYYSHIFRDSNMGVGLGNSMGSRLP